MTQGRPEPTQNPAPETVTEAAVDPLIETAMDWLLRLDSAPDDHALQQACGEWINADPLHGRAWRQAQRAWQLVSEVPPKFVTPPRMPATRSARVAQHTKPSRQRRKLVAFAMAACLLVALLPTILLHATADYVSGTGEQRRIALEDGSVLQLAAGSAVNVDFDGASRKVVLLRGEAFFDVAHDATRPFTVKADQLNVTVLGTAFDVRREQEAYTVGVQRGAVRVQHGEGNQAVDARLSPGQELSVPRSGGAAQHAINTRDVGAWRDGYLFVQDATVQDVISVLQRYQSGRIVMLDDAMASARVTGIYDLTHPESALRALIAPQQGRIRKITPLLYVVSSR